MTMTTMSLMMTMRLNFYHPNSTRGGVATAVSENAAHTNTWPYHARIRSTPKLALRRGAEARPARSRRMASAEGRRWQSLAQPMVDPPRGLEEPPLAQVEPPRGPSPGPGGPPSPGGLVDPHRPCWTLTSSTPFSIYRPIDNVLSYQRLAHTRAQDFSNDLSRFL